MKTKHNRIISAVLAAFMLISIFSMTSCKEKNPLDGLPEVIYYGSFEKLKENVKFDFQIPTKLPDGYLQTKAWTYDTNTVYITYNNGERELIFAAAKGAEANNDPEDIFNGITERDINGTNVKILERFSSPICVNLTKFTVSSINYALDSVTPEEAELMISSLQPISQVTDYTSALGADSVKYNSLSELSAAFGIDIPLPSDITPSSYELVGDTIAQVKFDYSGITYIYAVSKNSAAKDFFMYKIGATAAAGDIVGSTELFVEIYGVAGEDEESPNTIHMTAWANDEANFVLHTSKGATEEEMVEVSLKFYEVTPNTDAEQDAQSIDGIPIIEE